MGEQLSEMTGLQGRHTLPAVPHLLKDGVAQLVPSQQPVEHEVAPHPHTPFWQRRPGPQAGPAPQLQVPVAEHPSADTGSQPTHTAPPTPQVAREGGLHVAPEQHPSVQVALQPLQRPSVQVCPLGQVSHAPPPPPHDAAVSPARQVVPAQQPSAHEVPSHTQVLPMQRWPSAQAGPVPQRQAPLAEQLSLRASQMAQVDPASPQVASERVAHTTPWQHPLGHEVASQMHRPATQRWPPAHAGPVPHWQTPVLLQRLALVTSQAAHDAPAVPQAASEGEVQTPPVQQPFGHEVASHMQAPFMQRCPVPQGAALPQRHSPSIEQVSALSGSQEVQAAAPVPHADTERG